MAIFLNRARIRVYGGKEEAAGIKVHSWGYMNRFLLAKELGHLCGITGYRFFTQRNNSWSDNLSRRLSIEKNEQFILALEKRLRFLEKRGVIKVSQGKIYHTGQAFDLGDEGQGQVDLIKTIRKAITLAYNEVYGEDAQGWQNTSAEIERRIACLFRQTNDLTLVRQKTSLLDKTLVFLLNPLLQLESLDAAARARIIKIQQESSDHARELAISRHKVTAPNVHLIEQEMARVRATSMSEIHRVFDPRFTGFTMEYRPTREFSLVGDRAPGQPALVGVISDVHISSQKHPKQNDLLRYFYLCLRLGAPLVKNGDYYDHLVYSPKREKMRRNNAWLEVAKRRLKILYNRGNHDPDIKNIASQFESLGPNVYVPPTVTYYENHVLYEHGHQADRHNREGKKRGFYIVRILSFLGRYPLPFPHLMEWAEVAERWWYELRTDVAKVGNALANLFRQEIKEVKNAWDVYKIDEVIQRIRSEVARLEKEGEIFTPENPLLYIRGHDHGLGFSYTTEALVKAVYYDPVLQGKVRYYSTGSWQGDEAHVLFVDYSHPKRRYAYPFEWKTVHTPFVIFKAAA